MQQMWFDLWSGKIPNAVEPPIPCATIIEPVPEDPGVTTTEPTRHDYYSLWDLESMLHKRRLCNKKPPAPKLESSPCVLQREKSPHSSKAPACQKQSQWLYDIGTITMPIYHEETEVQLYKVT